MAITQDQLPQLTSAGGNVYTRQRDKIGGIGQIYLDNQTGEPKWVTVKTGLFGTSESFAPLTDAEVDGDDVVINYTKDDVKDAPRIESDGALSPDEEQQLYTHYGLGVGQAGVDQAAPTEAGYADTNAADTAGTADRSAGTTGRDTSGPTTDDAMTRSEERMHVGTRSEEVGRARLRKYVVTENVTQTVPVSHEEVRVEREPITDANRAGALEGPDISEEEHEVTLHGERPVVEKEAVPVERVRLDTETVTEQETVSGDVRKEEIDFDDSGQDRPTR